MFTNFIYYAKLIYIYITIFISNKTENGADIWYKYNTSSCVITRLSAQFIKMFLINAVITFSGKYKHSMEMRSTKK